MTPAPAPSPSPDPPQRRVPPNPVGVPLRLLEALLVLAALAGLVALALSGRDAPGAARGDLQVAVPEGTVLNPLLASLGFIVLNGLFTLCESAVGALKPHHLKRLPEDSPLVVRLQGNIERRAEIGAACAFGSQVTLLGLVLCGFLLTLFATEALGTSLFGGIGYGAIVLAATLVAIPLLLLNLVVGELVPRSLGGAHPLSLSIRLSALIASTSLLLSFPARVMVAVSGRFRDLAAPKPNAAETATEKEEEIRTLVESAEESGAIESDEKELITSVFEFTDTVAREVMTPRTDLDAMPIESDPKELVEVIERTGHSRIPLYEGTDDGIVGIIHAKDLLLAMVSYKPANVRTLMRPAVFVTESKSLHELLREMRQTRSQLAVVQDEFGGTAGIVTIEDIIEELVGEIQDEYDQEEPAVSETPDGYLVEGKTNIDDVNDSIGSDFESEDFDTIGGYVFGLFGRQPGVGEAVEAEGFVFTVAQTDGRRILKLRVEPSLSAPSLGDELVSETARIGSAR